MTNFGVVKEVNGDTLTIVFDRPEACGECHNCMHGSEECAKHTIYLKGAAEVGDIVTVELDDSHMVAATAMAYMVPLAGFLIGFAGGWALSRVWHGMNSELLMSLTAVLGTAAAYFIMKLLDPRLSKGRWEPKIVKITKPANQ